LASGTKGGPGFATGGRRDVPATTCFCPLSHHNKAISPRFHCAAPARSLVHQFSIHRSAYFTSSVHIRVGFRVLRGKFSSLRACGACTLPASQCDFGAWSVEAKLACLSAQNTQHTLPASPNTHLGAPPLALSHPHFPCILQLDLYPVRSITSPVALQGFVEILPVTSPSLPHPSERVRSASTREHRPWFCPASTTAADAPVLSASALCARALFTLHRTSADPQTVYQNKPFIRHYTLQIYSSTWIPL
jgi:hypothetical protein